MASDEELSLGLRVSRLRPPRSAGNAVAPPLLKLLAATDEAAYCECLDELIEATVSPIILRVVARRCGLSRPSQARVPTTPRELIVEDIHGQALVRVLAHLDRMWKDGTRGGDIADFEGYVRACAVNAWSDYLRQHNPRRRSLENQVLSALDRTEGLARWVTASGERLAGRRDWSEGGRAPAAGRRYERFLERPHRHEHELGGGGAGPQSLYDLVPSVVDWVNAPLPTADLVTIVQRLLGDHDPRFEAPAEFEPGEDPWARFEGVALGPQAAVLLKAERQKLWRVVNEMPLRWRVVLLLGPAVDAQADQPIHYFWLVAGIGLAEIARTIGEDEDGLARLCASLPLADPLIARRLGVGVGTVRNLRLAARQRLSQADTE